MYKFRQQLIKHNFREFKPGRALFPFLREEYQSEAEDKHHVILNVASVASGYILCSVSFRGPEVQFHVRQMCYSSAYKRKTCKEYSSASLMLKISFCFM